MNKTKLDMSAILAQYTAKVVAEEKIRQEIRDGIRPIPAPITEWNISDRD